VRLSPAELEQCGSFQSTPPVLNAWEISRQCAEALKAKKILFQCPASFTSTASNLSQLRHFFSSINRHGLTLIWEPRGNWDPALVQSLCDELDLIHAVDPFVNESMTPKFIYFRLHGGKGFKHVYSDEELDFLYRRISPGVPAYILFNNIQMLPDAVRLIQLSNR
jgi:uncharacterized protein YecE (DUF72 family)